jgi:3'-5' exoribonuclease
MRQPGGRQTRRPDRDLFGVEPFRTEGYARGLRNLRDGNPVDHVLLVRGHELRQARTGAAFIRLSLADRTGVVAGVVWDDVERASATVRTGEPIRVTGTFSEHPRYGRQVIVQALDPPRDVDWSRLVDGPGTPVPELERQLDALLASLQDKHLRALAEALLGAASRTGSAFRRAFAARYNHHAYRSGLLEHSLEVAHATAAAAEILPGIDRDLAVCGALLHDIGKLDAYSGDAHGVELNDTGKLIGEIPAGYYTVRRCIDGLPTFPPRLAETLLHIILSHHGCLEHGSPVLPATREALLVHTMDKLSGDLGSFDRLAREAADGQRWSRYDQALGRSVLTADADDSDRAGDVTLIDGRELRRRHQHDPGRGEAGARRADGHGAALAASVHAGPEEHRDRYPSASRRSAQSGPDSPEARR